MAARIAMIAMTTRSSMSVNACFLTENKRLFELGILYDSSIGIAHVRVLQGDDLSRIPPNKLDRQGGHRRDRVALDQGNEQASCLLTDFSPRGSDGCQSLVKDRVVPEPVEA